MSTTAGIRKVFSVVPRVADVTRCAEVAEATVTWSDQAGLDGVLHFTGSGAALDPWVAAARTCEVSERLIPFVAVNPAYQHPFAAARAVSSIAQTYRRPVALNLITGTSLSEMRQLGVMVDHDERYARLTEYAEILLALLASVRPVTRKGRHYQVENLQLLPSLDESLQPLLYLAGASPAAATAAGQLGAEGVGMLPATMAGGVPRAVHFGLVVREDRDAAWAAAHAAFPADPEGRAVVDASMANTDSVWKRRLVESPAGTAFAGYWLDPVRDGLADCPYVVGDRQDVLDLFGRLGAAGVRTVLLDVPFDAEDHAEIRLLMKALRGGGT